MLAGGATSSESELELLDEAALRLFDWTGVVTVGLVGCFFSPSSDESDEDASCFFLLLVFDWIGGFVFDGVAGVVGAKNGI